MLAQLLRHSPTVVGIAGSIAVLLFDARSLEPHGDARSESLTDRWSAAWVHSPEDALRLARERGVLVLVYAHVDSFACRTLERSAGAEALLSDELVAFVPLALDLDGDDDAARLAGELGIVTAPLIGAMSPDQLERSLTEPGNTHSAFDAPILPITGALYEPIGLAAELARVSTARTADEPPDDVLTQLARAEATGDHTRARLLLAGGLAREAQPNGVLHRFARLREAIRTHTVEGPADGEGTIEAALLVEEDARVLYPGWSLLASVFEQRAAAADASDQGTYRDASAARWRRRMRDASRLAWISCPDAVATPFGALLIERYGASVEDLDSLDRLFCRAVLRTLQRMAPESPRVLRAAEVVASM